MLRYLLFVVLATCLFAGCAVEGMPAGDVRGSAKVELLFEADGVKVYRFYDHGSAYYYTVDQDGNAGPVIINDKH